MALHAATHERPHRRSVKRNGLLQLGWPHFWLLITILGGMLALVVLILFVHLSSV
jgi:hypothetical protein